MGGNKIATNKKNKITNLQEESE